MAQGVGGTTVNRAVWIARILGLCIYVWAFFLPAVRQHAGNGNDAPDVFKGYICAGVTLINSLKPEFWHSQNYLAILSGWVNPLIALYLIFLVFPKFRWPRRIVAGLIVLFILGTWIFFYLYPLAPLLGHFLWIAGILLILAGEARGRAERI
ncbi:MAG: hypothetical protein ABR991_05200 [Terracidiphilus sp.]